MGIKVFLSYATKDIDNFHLQWIVRGLSSHPRIEKVFYWEDDAHGSIINYMNECVQECDVFVLFCSTNMLRSNPVQTEWETAQYLGKRIIPVSISLDHVPVILKRYRYIPFRAEDLQNTLETLYCEILKVCEVQPPEVVDGAKGVKTAEPRVSTTEVGGTAKVVKHPEQVGPTPKVVGRSKGIIQAELMGITQLPLTTLYAMPKAFRVTFTRAIPDVADVIRDYINLIDPSLFQDKSGGGRNNSYYFLSTQIPLYVIIHEKTAGFGTQSPSNHALQIKIYTNDQGHIRGIAQAVNNLYADGILTHIEWKKVENKYNVKKDDCIAEWKKWL
jgi:hypothetical protein